MKDFDIYCFAEKIAKTAILAFLWAKIGIPLSETMFEGNLPPICAALLVYLWCKPKFKSIVNDVFFDF